MAAWLGRLCVAVCARGGTVQRAARQALRPRWIAVRSFSASHTTSINYEELKVLLKKDGVVVIDVREPWEVKEYGIIKGSMNIPLGDLMSALKMTPKDFEEKYKEKLPEKSSTLVFSCLAGIRSGKALDVATSLGYSRVHHYMGGFDDWSKHELPEKQP
ncbi:thiosulfate sulfurtransferase/rhodanese-like domain-containing protein 3 [Bufo bufo]|uniref:thiosulfate sulfurtransferase/rhodanese-like domain-containing protein 3 n=1 Tax=Bufo bufo TaxID=8384 RepID=UPI001ABDBDA5|nr:thiosulfate sulfurtransferase/rhodanese-like domain-containing protein 3 [Bufo bufo]